jgi:hypothetical protein
VPAGVVAQQAAFVEQRLQVDEADRVLGGPAEEQPVRVAGQRAVAVDVIGKVGARAGDDGICHAAQYAAQQS